MEEDSGVSGPSWSVAEANLAEDEENIVHVPAVAFPAMNNGTEQGHTLLIGLDKNFFEQAVDTRDVLFINDQLNPNQIKFNDKNFLTPGNYVISFVETTKETSWETALLRNIRKLKQDESDFTDTKNETVDLEEPGPSGLVFTLSDCFVKDDKLIQIQDGLDGPSFEDPVAVPDPEERLPLKKKSKMVKAIADDVQVSELPITHVEKPSISAKWKAKRPGKRRCCYSDSEESEDEVDSTSTQDSTKAFESSSMADVVQVMRDLDLIDSEFADLLMSGLNEMPIDLHSELKSSVIAESQPSMHLLAFAFLLYFKKRPAYNFMGKSFGERWPNRERLREWRELVNGRPKTKSKKKTKDV